MIEFDRVSKQFGERRAIDAVSFDVQRGEMMALLGHNGAGKSTLFALALGLRRLTGGDIRVDGVSVRQRPRRARRSIGSVLAPASYEYMSGWDNLRIVTSYSGAVTKEELRAAVRFVGLEERIGDRVATYSHGMRRRLALAQALVPRPDVLLLDEWESGLDPEGVAQMRNLLERLNQEHAVTLLLSSHQPAGVLTMCDRVAILRHGRLAFVGPWSALDDPGIVVRLTVDDWTAAVAVLAIRNLTPGPDHTIAVASQDEVAAAVAALVHAGIRVHAVEPVRLDAEERYLRALSRA